MTFEQLQAEKELSRDSEAMGYTFKWNARNVGAFATGYRKTSYAPLRPVQNIKAGKLKSKSLEEWNRGLGEMLDQGNCGSCVIFAFTSLVQHQYQIKGLNLEPISPQHYMNCSSGSQCNGAYGEEIAQDAVRLGKTGGFYSEEVYPYIARTGRCQTKDAEKFAPIKSYKTLDGSDQSILQALTDGHMVAVGIAANGALQSYDSGLYNACNSMSINHYVVITALDCGKAVDKDGYCIFDSSGNLDKDSGATIKIKNSWGKGWGENGYIRMLLYGRNGRRCNGVAAYDGDAQILENGLPMPLPGPQVFEMEGTQAKVKVTVTEGATYTIDDLKLEIQQALDSLDGSKQ